MSSKQTMALQHAEWKAITSGHYWNIKTDPAMGHYSKQWRPSLSNARFVLK